ncbi:hypothetical protein TVAG_198890 [Trichomonas vaginalis G3]|uniref:Uncharacterized protein n=1 Tax=Trichomonas vaginalis (strain ATCC PRA-98 / G3) TaxID=412133 RepID=A2DDS4_TRIV3|nr:hypothetical protein TVAGG3_0999350 [Trichomonas vaginalis G3]EAY21450.1 hypothetical protein TVAG_198890 [Trichomonas vaginalis G3]KAI5490663.1 hypothetical protein TVAGG3_0999350 [Trichomonas vaginalis G3]|eukprot:XP_001582436.1 hypothetical protein [Trichomonas vaginalis G3]
MKRLSEKERTAKERGSFNLITSEAWKLLKFTFGKFDFQQSQINLIGDIFESKYDIAPRSRIAKRNKTVAIKFFQDNMNEFRDFCAHVSYQDKDGTFGGPTAKQAQEYIADKEDFKDFIPSV